MDDVRRDPRYLNALDAVRSELAVPMISRNKLVGVIDLQSTRERTYTRARPLHHSPHRGRASPHQSKTRSLYRRVDRQHRTLQTAGAAFAALQLPSWIWTNCSERLPRSVRTLTNFDAFSIYLVDAEQKGAAPSLQRPLRSARSIWITFRWGRESPARPWNRGSPCACVIPRKTRATSRRIPIFFRKSRCR